MFLCDGTSKLRIRIAPNAGIRAYTKKITRPSIKIKGLSVVKKANISVIYSGFRRGRGIEPVVPLFGSLFGNSQNVPSFAPKIMRASGAIKIHSVNIRIKRSPTSLPTQILDLKSQSIIDFGWDGIPSSVYDPPNNNNSTYVHSQGPQYIWSLIPVKSKEKNFKFIASLTRPVNNFKAKMSCFGSLKSKYFEKLHGHFNKINSFDNFLPTEKLFPIKDLQTEHNNIYLVNEKIKTDNLFESINEGVFLGNITKHGAAGSIISNDELTYITPSSIYTEGTFKYKCEVNSPNITPIESFFFLRAAAPIFNYESDIPPVYQISNIRLEDPSGNLIVKYKDFEVRGEANFEDKIQRHYITYVSEPEINNAALNTWKKKFPILGQPSGYTLSLDITGNAFYKPFTTDFTKGFEYEANLNDKFVNTSPNDYLAVDGSPLSTQTQNYYLRPTNAIKISAIEIANLGRGIGLVKDDVLPLFLEVQNTGTWLERVIYPTKFLLSNFSNDIYPTGINSEWVSSPDINNISYTNNNEEESFILLDRLTNLYKDGNVTLNTAPSGKLQLLYEHKKPFSVKAQRGGPFTFGNKNTFDKSELEIVFADDSYFRIEDIYLEVVAKKAVGSNDFPLDVVGYSDDKVLFITSDVGGFLQNDDTGTGNIPVVSGFNPINDLGISSESISDKYAYFKKNVVNIEAGDHYLISQSPLVNSTTFKTYKVPLKIYEDKVKFGLSKDYSFSTYFESLYLDIYPIPSGASISKANIVVKYKPSASMPLSTIGFEDKEIDIRQYRLSPSQRKSKDAPINSTINYPLSLIENIPQGYDSSEATLKTNYARRWRGSSGNIFAGPFDPNPFSFAFSNPQLDQPFTLGYYDFNKTSNNNILSSLENSDANITGVFVGTLSNSLHRNLGLRFNDNQLFNNPVRNYTSIDWAQSDHELYGKILDAFDNVVRLSGINGYIDFGNTPTSSGFSLYVRFSPDVTISGADYNLFNSGVIISKWDSDKELEYALGYNDGHLCAYAKTDTGDIVTVQDSLAYDQYQYPLSVVLTYNDNLSQKLRLFTNNEIYNGIFNIHRASSDAFILSSGNSSLNIGYSQGSGVGINAFVSEVGISTYHETGGGNLVYQSAIDSSKQQDNIETFFFGQSAKFWQDQENFTNDSFHLSKFVDEKTSDWKLGAFKYCSFNTSYDTMKGRNGKDYIYHIYFNDSQTYTSRANKSLPTNIHLSGISYHTQLENDMLRINLSAPESRFYSLPSRLIKNMPRGYLANSDALVVNTVLQHESDDDIIWPNGKKGAKLIVSLYTPSKESILFPTKNYGLLSRSTHYLNPEDCWNKIQSKFTVADYKDDYSEPWAFFDKTITKKEFAENYFNKDISQMFVQYDVVYPSGSYQFSKIKIHSLDVQLEGIVNTTSADQLVTLYSSGDKYALGNIPIYVDGYAENFNAQVSMFSSGVSYVPYSGDFSLFTSGVYNIDTSMPLYTIQVGSVSNANNFGSLYGNNNFGLNFFVDGGYSNVETNLGLFNEGFYQNAVDINSSLNLYTSYDFNPPSNATLSLFNLSQFALEDYAIGTSTTINMFVSGPDITYEPVYATLPLYVFDQKPEETIVSNLNLYLYHNKPIAKQENELESFAWNGQNYGREIELDDNQFASIPADDEIRGVQTICYGDCDTDANIKCSELPLITHDTLWYDPSCVDGGVIRPLTIYNNPNVNAFGTNVPYSGNFYGIRKFDNLIPQAPYKITIYGRTGSDEILDVPREMSEWEYGTNEDTNYSGIKLTANINNSGNYFGKDVTVLGDIVAVGCPYENILDENNYEIQEAGKIYVYRKAPAPSGYDWSNQDDKSNFVLEQEIVLPTGWRRDYFYTSVVQFRNNQGFLLPFEGVERNWLVSQEGRQLGHSLDSAKRGDIDIIVAGGPGAKWSRTFDPIQLTPVTIGLFVFNNELVTNPPNKNWQEILRKLLDRDLLYRYFCDPPVKFDIKIVLCEPLLGSNVGNFEQSEDFDYPQPNFVYKYLTHRHYSYDINSQSYKDRENVMLQELKDIFHEVFPLTPNALHSGIPPLLGFYIDNSRSLGVDAIGYGSQFRKGALDKFIDYYKDYSINNGLQNFNGNPSEGFTNVTVDLDEDWIAQSINCLLDITDIDNLQQNNSFQLFANNLGTFNTNASEFNNPPPSGGAVYVFEKQDDKFEIVQEIRSPVTYTDDVSDRFGHDVAISDDGKIIAIGSPYSQYAVQVFEYDENFNNILHQSIIGTAFINFLQSKHNEERNNETFGEAYVRYREYTDKLPIAPSINDLKYEMYNKSSEGLKYTFFKTYNLNRYNLIKTINYNEVTPFAGAWSSLFNNYVPTSRLGYSIDVNEDGSLVAIGCPTDSLGERDSILTWFRYDQAGGQSTIFGGENWQWQNYTNAGAVRLLESRNYYPHNNKVVEYYKFGNLHEILSDPNDSEFFSTSMANLYDSFGYDFSRTSFSEDLKIPQDAGLAFIITPAIDAASDEIIDNIREWLSLGDRHLVLVGNDPFWENNGAYAQSNKIINYILEQLDINLRIYAARNKYEALIDDTNVYYNVQQSFVPQKTTRPIGYPTKLRGYGVGDIRLYDENILDLYSCDKIPPTPSDPFTFDFDKPKTYRQLHDLCEMPIVHEGDLRAKYIAQCEFEGPRGIALINYERNLAYAYGSHNVINWGCNIPKGLSAVTSSPNERDKSEPIPMLSAYEAIPRNVFIPATPDEEGVERVIVDYDTTSNTFLTFSDSQYDGLDFIWSNDDSNYVDLKLNINNIVSRSLFFDPLEYNGKNAVLQARSFIDFKDENKPVDIKPNVCMVASEDYGNRSKVVLIASTLFENKNVLLSSAGDKNLNLYFNLLALDKFGNAKVAQVGGFTNRASYLDGYSKSDIQLQLTNVGINMSNINVPTSELYDVSKGYTAAWIANTDRMPSDDDISNIKRFLDLGNKTLIITYGQDPALETQVSSSSPLTSHMVQAANVAKYICEKLNVSLRPLFLTEKNKYASRSDVKNNSLDSKENTYNLLITNNTYVYNGFDDQSSFKTGSEFDAGYGVFSLPNGFTHETIPINTNNGINIAYFDFPIEDNSTITKGVPQLKTGITKVTFSIPEKEEVHDDFNLFRLFFDYCAESDLEISPLRVYVANCNSFVRRQPLTGAGDNTIIKDIDDNNDIFDTLVKVGAYTELQTASSSPQQKELNIQIPSGQTELDIYIVGTRNYALEENPRRYLTNRLLSISGVRVPVDESITTNRIPIYGYRKYTIPGSPEVSYTIDIEREISTDSAKYCISNEGICAEDAPIGYGTPGLDIADGPVVMAQAVYHQGGYFNGYNKSRVTVISDPSLIQGRTILAENSDRINPNLPWFLASLYPSTNFNNTRSGRQYETSYKLISPERASPSRLINAYPNNSGLNYRFGQYISNSLPATKYSDTEGKKEITVPPGKDKVQAPFDPMESLFDVSDVGKFRKIAVPPINYTEQQKAILAQAWYVDNFETIQAYYGSTSKIQDYYNNILYKDAGMFDIIPPILRETGHDHLDTEVFYSGYPGDLFGYSVKIHKNKLYIGSPFSPYNNETITPWSEIVTNGMQHNKEVGFNGGAGAVYVIEKVGNVGDGPGSINNSVEKTSGLPWKVTKKIRPPEINVGFTGIDTSTSQTILGSNNYSQDTLNNLAFVSDMFGHSIALNGDILAISAPGHDFETYFEENNAPYIRKEFNEQFDIKTRTRHDLGLSSERSLYGASGVTVLNHGAVFTFENKISDWGSKTQDWVQIHKLVSQGPYARIQNSGENTFFGNAIAIDRARRSDGDYILAVGAKNHALSNNDGSYTENAGATYAYDGMLRKIKPAFSHPDTFIAGRVYGEYNKPADYTTFTFKNGTEFNKEVLFNGAVLSNIDGEIFIEVSGQDKVAKGYVIHRPYIEYITGTFLFGTPVDDYLDLYINGKIPDISESINMISFGPESVNVYNTLDLYTKNILVSSGVLPLFASGLHPPSGTLSLYASGISSINTDLRFRTRGSY